MKTAKNRSDDLLHIVRMGAGAYKMLCEKRIKGLFYTQLDDGTFEVIDNRKGKMVKYTCKTLEECAACVNK